MSGTTRSGLLRCVAAAAVGSLLFAASASANAITVNTTADSSASDCTLRDAITAANTATATGGCSAGAVGNDNITITPTGTIQLASALPQIQSSMTITGPGAANLSVRGEAGVESYDIFDIYVFDLESAFPYGRPVVTISDLTITNGAGGVQNGGILTLDDATVRGNSITVSSAGDAFAGGAGIQQCPCGDNSSLTLSGSKVSGNSVSVTTSAGSFSQAAGAAIQSDSFPVTIDQSTISDNTATATGGTTRAQAKAAIYALDQDLTITRSTISGNTTSASNGDGGDTLVIGGGVSFESFIPPPLELSLDRVTVTGNTATGGLGGGIYVGNKTASIDASTISGNTAGTGANVYSIANEVTFMNTIIANPLGPTGVTNCFRDAGDFTSAGYNLDSGPLGDSSTNNNCLEGGLSSDQGSTDPALGPLQANGGPTQTMAPGVNSPAVDKGKNPQVGPDVAEDQRGFTRPFDMGPANATGGDGTDVGAFEQVITASPTSKDFSSQQWGTTSPTQAFTLSNRTGNAFPAGSLALGGTNPGDFQLSGDTCSNTANNANCGVNAAFAPVSPNVSAALVALTGTATGYTPASISVAPTTKDFGSTQAGTPTTATQFTVTNTGLDTSGTLATALNGANASEFGITQDNCNGQTLLGGGTCTVSVRFAPSTAGSDTASLNISGTPGGTTAAALSGSATEAPPAADTTPPETTITKGPKDKTKEKQATFEFSGSDARAVAGFECSLDGGTFTACTSPHTVKVNKGKHTFSVRALDAAGNTGAAATDDWTVKKKKKKK